MFYGIFERQRVYNEQRCVMRKDRKRTEEQEIELNRKLDEKVEKKLAKEKRKAEKRANSKFRNSKFGKKWFALKSGNALLFMF